MSLLARIILDGVIVISLLLLYVDCAVWLSLSIIIEFKESNYVLTYINILVWLLNIIGMWVFSFLCARKFMTLMTECMLPERYKSELSERIARLRKLLLRRGGS